VTVSRFFYSICCGSCSIRPRKCSEWYYVPQCYNYESASTWRLNRQLSRLYGSTRAALGEKVAEAQRHLQILIEDQRKLAEMSVSECYDPITYMVPCLACFRLDLPAYGQFYRAMDQWTYETFLQMAGDRKLVSSISIRLGPHARSERAIALRRWIDLASQLPLSIRVICHATTHTDFHHASNCPSPLWLLSHQWLDIHLKLPTNLMEYECGDKSGQSMIQTLSLTASPGDSLRRRRH